MKKIFIIIFCLFLNIKAMAQPVKSASLSFAWSDPVSLAVFERNDYIWLVFNRRKVIDIKGIEEDLSAFNATVLNIPHSKATVLRLKLSSEVSPSVRKEGLLWVVDFVEGGVDAKTQGLLTQVRRDGLDRPYIFIENDSFADPISIIDPDIGDVIITIPSLESSVAVLKNFSFVDFDILKSIQGFAIIPNSDGISVIRSNDGASIKSLERGLLVSDDLDDLQRLSLLNMESDSANVFELNLPATLLEQSFFEAQKFLKKDINDAKGDLKVKAKFQLAKYYVSKALGLEAIGLLNQILTEENITYEQKQQVYGLRGAANFLSRRYDQALADLSYGELIDNKNANFWRRLVEAAKNPFEYNKPFINDAAVIKDYPIDLQVKVAEIAAQTSINARDDLGAQNFIDILKLSGQNNAALMPKLLFLTAQNLYLQRYPRDSLDRFEEIIASPSQEYSSYARFAAAMLAFEIKAKKIDETISELERLRFAWAKKTFKIRILKTLADLYSRKHDYNNAVAVMIEEYNLVDDIQKKEVRKRIVKLFEDLYIENQADETPALKALGLYNEHLDIIKESKRYIDIAISVADRFFAVDLADNAKNILKNLLEKEQISEEQKYKIGTRLAFIYLYQNLYNYALESLDNSQILMPDVSLENYRDVIKASAYKGLGMYDDALKVLENNYSTLATLQKSEIYWLNEDYENLSLELKYLIEEPEKEKPLSDEQVKYILDWLMALKKAKKDIVLARARAKFLPWFEGGKYYSTFDILTSQFDYDKVDMAEIANRIKNIEIYSDFNKKIAENLKNIAKSEAKK